MTTNADELVQSIVELNEQDALRIVRERLDSGDDLKKIIELCREAMVVIGERFEKNEYFLSDLIVASTIFSEIMEIALPRMLERRETEYSIGKMVIGTVEGDVHNIGKDIVVSMLRANGFEVHDLGVDVPAVRFVSKIKETNAKIVGMSALITVGWESMKRTIKAIEEAGLRDKVKIVVGGGIMNEEAARYVGADAYATLNYGIRLCKNWASV